MALPSIQVSLLVRFYLSFRCLTNVIPSQTGSLVIHRPIYSQLECGNIKLKFAHDDSLFEGGNTTFFVNVYNFKTPLIIQISFSQHRNLDLLQFFLTFSSCFLALLITAAILWKIKQRYELARRRQVSLIDLDVYHSQLICRLI